MTAALYNLVRVTTPSVGVGLVIALGPKVPGFNSFIDAGVPDGAIVSLALSDSGNSEQGRYTYSLSAQTVTRTDIMASTSGGAAINLSGFAQVAISPLAQDLSPNAPIFDTFAAVTAANIPLGTTSVEIRGFYQPGDGGAGILAYSQAQPSVPGSYTRSVDGAYWQISTGQNNVLKFGAKADGVTDSTAAFIACAAANAGRPIYAPGGHYVTSQALTLVGLIGDPGATVITVNSTTAAGIVVTVTAAPYFFGFSLLRSGTPVAGALGIDVSNGTSDAGVFQDLLVKGHWINLALGPTNRARLIDVDAIGSLSDNILLKNTVSNGSLQWQADSVYATDGVGIGVHIVAIPGPPQITTGQLNRVETFANTGGGFWAEGLPSCPIQGIRANHCFFGADGSHEVMLNTYNDFNNAHQFTGCFAEAAGTGGTGPSGLTLPSNHGSGVFITANNAITDLGTLVSDVNSFDGVTTAGAVTIVSGSVITNNGLAGSGSNQNGINVLAGKLIINGGKVGQTAALATQKTGIALASGVDHCIIDGVDLTLNANQPILDVSGGSRNVIQNCDGYNPVGVSNPSVGASPFVYTAGSSTEFVTLYGGTVNAVTHLPSGLSIVDIGVAPVTVPLPPNGKIQITYTAVPVMVVSKH